MGIGVVEIGPVKCFIHTHIGRRTAVNYWQYVLGHDKAFLFLALDVADGDVGAVSQQHIDPDALPVAEPVAGTLDLDQARTRRRGGLWYGRARREKGCWGVACGCTASGSSRSAD